MKAVKSFKREKRIFVGYNISIGMIYAGRTLINAAEPGKYCPKNVII